MPSVPLEVLGEMGADEKDPGELFDQRETIALEQRQLVAEGWDTQTQAPTGRDVDVQVASDEVTPGAVPMAPRPVSLALARRAEGSP